MNEVVNSGVMNIASLVVSVVVPVSYTHLDVYKRQVLNPAQRVSILTATHAVSWTSNM